VNIRSPASFLSREPLHLTIVFLFSPSSHSLRTFLFNDFVRFLEYTSPDMSVLFYRRPDYLNKASGPITSNECARYVERAKSAYPPPSTGYGSVNTSVEFGKAIPDGLSFEDVMNKKAMPVRVDLLLSYNNSNSK
jgi:hypothetical protein